MPNTKYLLVGTKIDCRSNSSVLEKLSMRGEVPVLPEDGHMMAQEIGAYKYIECSSFEMTNINLVFEEALRCALEDKYRDHACNKKKQCTIL